MSLLDGSTISDTLMLDFYIKDFPGGGGNK